MTKQNPSYQRGASEERAAFRRFLQRELKSQDIPEPTRGFVTYAIAWLEGRTIRFNAKPGGLGKKPKVKQSLTLSPKSLAAKIKDAKRSLPAANGEAPEVVND